VTPVVRSGAAAALLLLGMALAPDRANAARVADVVMVVAPRCPTAPFDVASLLTILRAELGPVRYDPELAATEAAADAAGGGGRAVLRLETVPCDPATASVEATYSDARTERRIRKRVDLTDVARDGRARVLALVLAEWLREEPGRDRPPDSAPALPASSERPPASPPPAAPAPGRPSPSGSDAAPHRLGLRVAADARVYSSFATPLAGGRIGASVRARALPVRVVLDAGLLAGTTHLEFGAVDVRAAVASAGIDLMTGGGRLALAIGTRVELGRGWIVGHAGDPSVRSGRVDGPLVGAALVGALDVHATPAFEPFLEVEAGLIFAEIVGLSDGARAAGFTGPWVGGRAGARIGF